MNCPECSARGEVDRLRGLLYTAKVRFELIRDEIKSDEADCDKARAMSMSASDGLAELNLDGDLIPEEAGFEASQFHSASSNWLEDLRVDSLAIADTCRVALNQWRELWEREEQDNMFTDPCAEAVLFRKCHTAVAEFYGQYQQAINGTNL